MQLDKICDEMAEHIAKMCMSDLSVDHADFRLKELMRDELFAGIQDKVNQRLANELVKMSKYEATIQEARDKLKTLVRMKSGLFSNLSELVKQQLEIEKCKQSDNSSGA